MDLLRAYSNTSSELEQALASGLSKLVENPDGDRIDLCIRREADQLVFDLTDTGVGLPEDRERLTEPYMTTRVRGTGLGLAIVKKIVDEHHGRILVENVKPHGANVSIVLPSKAA